MLSAISDTSYLKITMSDEDPHPHEQKFTDTFVLEHLFLSFISLLLLFPSRLQLPPEVSKIILHIQEAVGHMGIHEKLSKP